MSEPLDNSKSTFESGFWDGEVWNENAPHVSDKAHIRYGQTYVYKPLPVLGHGNVDWLKPRQEVRCCHTLDGEAMYCIVETLDRVRFGKVNVRCLKLNVDFSRR